MQGGLRTVFRHIYVRIYSCIVIIWCDYAQGDVWKDGLC